MMSIQPTKEEETKYDKYAVECAARTLMEAEEIKQDPKMMKLVQAHMTKKKKAITSIQDLRNKADEMSEDEGMEEE